MILSFLKEKYRSPLAKSILVKILLFSSVVTLLLTATQLVTDYHHQVGDLEHEVEMVNKVHLRPISHALWTFNDQQLEILVNSLVQTKGILYVQVSSPNGDILSSSGTKIQKQAFITKKSYPIIFTELNESISLGHIDLYISTRAILNDLVHKSLFILASQLVKTMAVSIFILIILFRLVINPLLSISEYTQNISLENLNQKLELPPSITHNWGVTNSLGHIAESINSMIQTIHEDIKEKEELTQKISQAKKMELLGKLSGGVAHDFNNILQIVHNTNSMIEYFKDKPEKIQKYVNISRNTLEVGEDIVKNILLFCRNEKMDKVPLDFVQVIEEVIEMGKNYKLKDIDIIFNNLSQDRIIESEKLYIYQIITNLVNNAVDAIDKENGKIEITLESKTQNNYSYFELIIKDNGHGIDENKIDQVLAPYYSTKESTQGTGLGLSIVYGIIKDHEGEIEIKSKKEEGTSFIIHLPLNKEIQHHLSSELPIASENAPHQEKVIFIDDEENIIETMQTLLKLKQLDALFFKDSKEAEEYIKKNSKDISLIITDFNMPQKNGAQLAKDLYAAGITIPIILTSGHIPQKEFSKNIQECLAKPYCAQELLDKIQKIYSSTKSHQDE